MKATLISKIAALLIFMRRTTPLPYPLNLLNPPNLFRKQSKDVAPHGLSLKAGIRDEWLGIRSLE